MDLVIEELSLTTPNNGGSTVQLNITAHGQLDVDTPAVRVALWEKQGIITAPIPAPFSLSAPRVGSGHDLALVIMATLNRTNGARLTSQGVIVTNTQIVTNYTGGFDYNTNTNAWSAWVTENPSIIVTPPLSSYRAVGYASGSTDLRRGFADLTITTCSVITSGESSQCGGGIDG